MGKRPRWSQKGSGRQLLAATRATGGDDLAATDRGHAGAEAVTALAHELAGLIGPLHDNAPVLHRDMRKLGSKPRAVPGVWMAPKPPYEAAPCGASSGRMTSAGPKSSAAL